MCVCVWGGGGPGGANPASCISPRQKRIAQPGKREACNSNDTDAGGVKRGDVFHKMTMIAIWPFKFDLKVFGKGAPQF